jgi:hypothetical protein
LPLHVAHVHCGSHYSVRSLYQADRSVNSDCKLPAARQTQRQEYDAVGVAKCAKAIMQERPGPPNPWLTVTCSKLTGQLGVVTHITSRPWHTSACTLFSLAQIYLFTTVPVPDCMRASSIQSGATVQCLLIERLKHCNDCRNAGSAC